jgi:Zn-dependent metalloprotease
MKTKISLAVLALLVLGFLFIPGLKNKVLAPLQGSHLLIMHASQGNVPNLEKAKELFEKNNVSLSNFIITRVDVDELGMTHVRGFQTYQSLPVFTGDLIYHFTKNGEKRGETDLGIVELQDYSSFVSGNVFDPKLAPSLSPKLSAQEAFQETRKRSDCQLPFTQAELGIFDPNATSGQEGKEYVLVWSLSNGGNGLQSYVDAQSGTIYYCDNGIRY